VQEILETSAQAEFEIFQLLGSLVFQSLRRAIKDPTVLGKVRLHYAHAAAAEFRAFMVGKGNVIDEPHGDPRHAVFVIGEETATGDCLHRKIAIAAHSLDRSLHDLFGFVVGSRGRSVGRLSRAPYGGDQHEKNW